MKTLNMNATVRIKLTSIGIKRLEENHEKLCKKYPLGAEEFKTPVVDENGFTQMTLWVVMNTFGDLLINGSSNLPFETDIQIDDSEFEKS